MFAACGDQHYKVASSMAIFESKEDVKTVDRGVADVLKEMFKHHLPRVETDEADAKMEMQEEEDNDDLFGGDSAAEEVVRKESTQARKQVELKQEEHKVVMSEDSGEDDIF